MTKTPGVRLQTDGEILIPPRPDTAVRFWSKVNKLPDDGCWEWTANFHPAGYGVAHVDGRDRPARKVAWIWEYGLFPHGKFLHPRCLNDRCIRPSHHIPGRRNQSTDGTKMCGRCKLQLPESDFGAQRRRGAAALQSYCKACARIDRGERRDLPGARDRDHEQQAIWRVANPWRPRHLPRKYGISVAEYEAISERQGHVCAICGRTEQSLSRTGGARRLAVDHCHESARVRGLLCFDCNTAIGKFQDDPALLRAAAAYLELHQQTQPQLTNGN